MLDEVNSCRRFVPVHLLAALLLNQTPRKLRSVRRLVSVLFGERAWLRLFLALPFHVAVWQMYFDSSRSLFSCWMCHCLIQQPVAW